LVEISKKQPGATSYQEEKPHQRRRKMSKILMILATAAVAVTLALPANAGPRGAGGYSVGGHWSPYAAGEGSPQIDGAGGN
jgi:hypothetical protein